MEQRHPERSLRERGLSMVELAIVVAVLVILASIAVPMVRSGLQTARIGRAIADLNTICREIKTYKDSNFGELPLTLAEIGYGDRRDPWGNPYCYLNYATGTGDGMDWALSSGLLDPGAVVPGAAAPAAKAGSQGVGTAISAVASGLNGQQVSQLVQSLKGRQTPVFVSIPVDSVRRRDQHLLPLNTDFDLFSLGPDGRSAVALGNRLALDDVIRANNGRYIGEASKY